MVAQYDQHIEFGHNPKWYAGEGGGSLRDGDGEGFTAPCHDAFRSAYPGVRFDPVWTSVVLMEKRLVDAD